MIDQEERPPGLVTESYPQYLPERQDPFPENAFDWLPTDFKKELGMFLSPDHQYALKYADASLSEAVEMIRSALQLTDKKFDEDSLKWMTWWESEAEIAKEHAASWPLEIIMDQLSQKKAEYEYFDRLDWGFPPDSRRPLPSWPPPDHVMQAPDRWRHWVNDRVSAFFYLNDLRPNHDEDLRMRAEPMELSHPLVLLHGTPTSPNIVEEACRIAESLTATTSESRGRYRLKRFVSGGPNIPKALYEMVSHILSKQSNRRVPETTARDYLIKCGFSLPSDLILVKKSNSWKSKKK